MLKRYTLYLDESETHQKDRKLNKDINKHFCMAGIIVADDDYNELEKSINDLKRETWSDLPNPENVILHQIRITDAVKGRLDCNKYPEYQRFSKNNTRKTFYNNLKNTINLNKINIIGGSICNDDLDKYFNVSKNSPDKYLICLQLLLENYCHFLCKNNGFGRIIYESRELISDEKLRNRFYHIKLMGSMYINKAVTDKYLLGIDFLPKNSNCAGLQLADFIPNSFAKDHGFIPQSKYNIFGTLKYYRYDGYIENKKRFGIKYMP